MNLLIDLGNTRLKWAISEGNRLTPGAPIANSLLSIAKLTHLWQVLETPKRIGLACVGNDRTLALVKKVIAQLWPKTPVRECQSQYSAFGVTNAYQHPQNLGIDRWLALIATHQLYRTAACIVDCGTAITIDLLAANGLHRGGYICPGLKLMKQSLYKKTQQLPLSNETFHLEPATCTEAAIFGGTLNAALGLISHVMAQQSDAPELILTGGDAELLAGYMQPTPTINPELIFYGLAIVLTDQSSNDNTFWV